MLSKLYPVVFALLVSGAVMAQTRIISHVTSASGGFTTTVVVENDAAVARTATFDAYDNGGALLGTATLDLEPGTVVSRTAEELFSVAGVSHFVIRDSDDLQVGVNYDFQAGNGSPAFVKDQTTQGSNWRMFPGNWDNVFDGVAVVNTGEVATDVWIAQKDLAGNIIDTRQIATGLAPNAKALYVIGSPNGSDFSSETPSYYEVSGEQLLAITALRGTLASASVGLLWSNEARVISQSSSKRDDRGVWFIQDGSMENVMEMMGYNHAVDRLWQLDIFRRGARGNLAEIFGPTALSNDRFQRSLSYRAEEIEAFWNDLSEENKAIITSYVAGINRRIAQVNFTAAQAAGGDDVASLLPVEYSALGVTSVVPYTIRDVMQHMSEIQRGFSMRRFGLEQVQNARILQGLQEKYGAEQAAVMFNDLRPTVDLATQTMIYDENGAKTNAEVPPMPLAYLKDDAPDFDAFIADFGVRAMERENYLKSIGAFVKSGSMAWAVSGDKTASGNPILYSGPQMGFNAPDVICEGSIESDYMNVSGMMIVGIPAILVGRTPHHAWSMQVGHASCWDYYVDDIENLTGRMETFHVAGGESSEVEFGYNERGPFVSVIDGKALVFQYAHKGYEFDLYGGIHALARAESMDAFSDGIGKVGITQHFTYVDGDNNIGYWLSGRTPVRQPGDYRVPQGVLANQDVLEWDAANIMPNVHERNPAKGYYAGWNNKADDNWVDYAGTAGFGPYQRGHLIRDYFNAFDPENPWSFEDLRDFPNTLAANTRFYAGGNPWHYLESIVKPAVENAPTQARQDAMTMMDEWDGQLIPGGLDGLISGTDHSDGGLFLEALVNKLIDLTFLDELGVPESTNLPDTLYRFQTFLHMTGGYGLDKEYDWFTNLDNPSAPQTSQDVIVTAVDEVLADLGQRPWGQGIRPSIVFNHFIFRDVTLPPISTALGTEPVLESHRATYSQVVEFGPNGPVRIESAIPLSQSWNILGTPFAPVADDYFFNFRDDFANYRLRPFPLFGE